MESDIQTEADRRLEDDLARTGARDPRALYRGLLRELKTRSPDGYEGAVGEYRESVLGAIARGEAPPLETWLGFGLRLAELTFPGRTVLIDASGRARPFHPPPAPVMVLLHLPDDRKQRAIPVGLPAKLSPAQEATVALLAEGKLRIDPP